jgi:hypothetical protein
MDQIAPENIQQTVDVLSQADESNPLIKARLNHLKDALKRLLAEIEEYEHVVFCRSAVACLLQSGVIRILAGSKIPAKNWWSRRHNYLVESGIVAKHDEVYVFEKDYIFHAPSPAAEVVLGRNANGHKEWKDKRGRSINAIRKEEAAT